MPVGATPPLAVHALGADLNVYAYVGGQTFAAVDPWGLEGESNALFGPLDSFIQGMHAAGGARSGEYTRPNGTTVTWTYTPPPLGEQLGVVTRVFLTQAMEIAENGLDVASKNADLMGALPADALRLGNHLAQPGATVTAGGFAAGAYEAASPALSLVLEAPDIGLRASGTGDVGPEVGRFVVNNVVGVVAAGAGAAGSGSGGAGPTVDQSAVRGGAVRGGSAFEIVDGVRRAKAAEMLGREVTAQVKVGEKIVGTLNLDPRSLTSPTKTVIDVSSPRMLQRWMRVLQGTRAGDSLPPITVSPGTSGTPIPLVDFKF